MWRLVRKEHIDVSCAGSRAARVRPRAVGGGEGIRGVGTGKCSDLSLWADKLQRMGPTRVTLKDVGSSNTQSGPAGV